MIEFHTVSIVAFCFFTLLSLYWVIVALKRKSHIKFNNLDYSERPFEVLLDELRLKQGEIQAKRTALKEKVNELKSKKDEIQARSKPIKDRADKLELGQGKLQLIKATVKEKKEKVNELNSTQDEVQARKTTLKAKIDEGRLVIKKAEDLESTLKDQVDQIELGLSPPVFSYNHPETFKLKIDACRDAQYITIKNGDATYASSQWTFFGSVSDGNAMVADYKSLQLKAFNAEFETIVRKMRHSTIETAKNKLEKLHNQLTKLGETANVAVSRDYFWMKEKELLVWAEYLNDQQTKKEQRKQERALLRNNKFQSGQSDLESLEGDISATEIELLKAHKKAEELIGAERKKLERQIAKIELQKAALEEKFRRATSQAQLTRNGYIYCISNIGSFGEGVVKIGMTRRLEPMDRVRELGDASVPYKFDVHTLAFVKDAPAIEKALHLRFNEHRVNTENHRKEFFQVSPEEVQDAFDEMGIVADWFFDIEAKEYRESELMRKALKQVRASEKAEEPVYDTLPEYI
ncbi:DUF4041 domain-containing protein [Marinomonas sp. 15G1-11]|uniref:DUF4041 domain-containing protein n=1 Tax=Marinomonas phaeophyticola TaxID=3004091 RepID=A0ABT4JY39_9GAMM|nr:DUF4041 domain-containing protein [Marinomonas sp. 15G1-11]MCZ2722972.1 DUF4041 domain-containing protein [Marinomonas sp. 15G1-11]